MLPTFNHPYQQQSTLPQSSAAKYALIFFLIIYTIFIPTLYHLYIAALIEYYKSGEMALFYSILIVILPHFLSFIDFYFILLGGTCAVKLKKLSFLIQLTTTAIVGIFTLLAIIMLSTEGEIIDVITNPIVQESVLLLICNGLSYTVMNEQSSRYGYIYAMHPNSQFTLIPMQDLHVELPISSEMPQFAPYSYYDIPSQIPQ